MSERVGSEKVRSPGTDRRPPEHVRPGPSRLRRAVRVVAAASLRRRLTAVGVLTFAIFALAIDMGGLWGVVTALYGIAGAVAATWLAWVTAPADPPADDRRGNDQAGNDQPGVGVSAA